MKTLSKNTKYVLILLAIASVVVAYLYKESFTPFAPLNYTVDGDKIVLKQPERNQGNCNVRGFDAYDELEAGAGDDLTIDLGTKCGETPNFLSSNLLPKEDDSYEPNFADFAPKKADGQNFLDSGKYTIGMQSQSLRNANYQLRSEIPNPQTMVCPWMQSTISPDTSRPNLEIGSAPTTEDL